MKISTIDVTPGRTRRFRAATLRVWTALCAVALLATACDVHSPTAAGSLASITVTPNATLTVGATQQFIAVGRDAEGAVVPLSASWSIISGGGTIDGAGMFTAGMTPGVFTATVRAGSGSTFGTANVTVIVGALATITVTPTPDTLLINGTRQYVAVGRDMGGNVVPLTPVWSVAASGGTINATGFFTAGTVAGTFTNTITATSGSIAGRATLVVRPGALAFVTVTANPDTLAINASRQFTATGTDAAGNVVAITPVWSVANGGGTINTTGIFTAGTVAGTFANTVRATSGALSGTATVVVLPGVLASITVTPNPDTLVVGTSRQFIAVGRDAAGNIMAVAPTWSVVANGGTITAGGLFTAGLVAGTFTNTIRASSGAISGTATMVVLPGALATVTVTPNPDSLAVGATRQFVAVGRDANNNTVAITPTWTLTAGGGTLSSTGLFTAGTLAGTFTNTIRATSGLIAGSATVVVLPGALASVTVTPNPDTLAVNATQQFIATGRDANNNVIAIAPTWAVVAGGGSIGVGGLLTAGTVTGTFTNTVRATSGAITGFATLVVIPGALNSITVTPNPDTTAVGLTKQFIAVGRDANNNVIALSPTWSVVAGGGTIGSGGLFTAGTAVGTFTNTIRASSGAIAGFATEVVIAGPLAVINVTPNPATIGTNTSQQFTAVGRDANNNPVPITPSWSVTNGGGTIDVNGLFLSGNTAATFTNTVRATSGAINGTATVVVTAGALTSITVTPNPDTTAVGLTKQFIAVGRDANNNVVALSPTWSVVAGGGTIGLGGLFTAGTVAGTFTNTIRASSGAISGFATEVVIAGPLAVINVTPNPDTTAVGLTKQFIAVGRDANNNVIALSPTWSVVAGGGTIGLGGLFTAGTAAGTFTNTIRASSGAIAGFATEEVIAGPLAVINVTPNPGTLAINSSQQFTAVGRDANNNPVPISPSWSVTNGGGTIDVNGLFLSGNTTGTFTNTVRATSGAINGTATVIVTLVAANILGAAAPNGITAGTAVTCVTGGIINADVSISPGNTITGYPPCVITGTQNLGNAAALAAQASLIVAYNTLAGLPCPPANAIVADLGGTTKPAGVYCSATGIGVTGTLTLDGGGDPNATFVFQAGSSLTTAGNIVLINQAQAKNVYFQIGSSATVGTASQWQGNIVALTSITLVDNATLTGRALARNGAVSLGTNNVITLP